MKIQLRHIIIASQPKRWSTQLCGDTMIVGRLYSNIEFAGDNKNMGFNCS